DCFAQPGPNPQRQHPVSFVGRRQSLICSREPYGSRQVMSFGCADGRPQEHHLARLRRPLWTTPWTGASGREGTPADQAVEWSVDVLGNLDWLSRVTGRLNDHHVVWLVKGCRRWHVSEVARRLEADMFATPEGVGESVLNLAQGLGHDRRFSVLQLFR